MALPSCVYRKASARRQPAVGEWQELACWLSLGGRFRLWGSLLWTSSPHPLCHCSPYALLLNRQEMQKGGENSWNGSIQRIAAVWNPPQLAPVSPTSGFSFLLLHLVLTQNMLNQWAGRPGRDWTDKFSRALYWRKDSASLHGDSVFLSC